MEDRPLGSAIRDHIKRHGISTHSVRLHAMTTASLRVLSEELRYGQDAHRETVCQTNGATVKFCRRVDPALRDYLQAVDTELLTRQTDWYSNSCRNREPVPSRYESRRPVNVLRRVADKQSQGTVSLCDMQTEYRRLKHG